MKLENQVCSFKQGKKLQELGITAQPLFWHTVNIDPITPNSIIQKWQHSHFNICKKYPAFTISELGQMLGYENLPYFSTEYDMWILPKGSKLKSVGLGTINECEIRSELLLYAIEQGLMSIEICNSRLVE